jgi:hypothetical protein
MKAGWVLGTLFTTVVGFAGVCQSGLLGGHVAREASAASPAAVEDVLKTPAGWRYMRGQPSHWKYLMMKR